SAGVVSAGAGSDVRLTTLNGYARFGTALAGAGAGFGSGCGIYARRDASMRLSAFITTGSLCSILIDVFSAAFGFNAFAPRVDTCFGNGSGVSPSAAVSS